MTLMLNFTCGPGQVIMNCGHTTAREGKRKKKRPVGGGSWSEKPPSCHQYAHHEPVLEHQIDCRIKCTLSIVSKSTFAAVGINAKSNDLTGAAVRCALCDVVSIIIQYI